MSKSNLTMHILDLKNQKYNCTPNKCPEGITFEMLMEEINPESNYENTKENKNILWKKYYIVCLSPNQFGFYVHKDEIDKNNENIKISWYKLKSDEKKL